MSDIERIKEKSDYLRGTIRRSIASNITGAVTPDDVQVLKFHGIYQQDDRDLRNERARQKLEPAYQFMLRVRIPGGILTSEQWRTLDGIAQEYGGNTFRLTTRQSLQFHGIVKWELKSVVNNLNSVLLDSLAACGDVNRNTMCCANPYESTLHAEVYELSTQIAELLAPRTRAYHEIWIDNEKVADSRGADGEKTADDEPIYGRTYMPRKFKIAITIPPLNDVDVLAHDLGFIAIVEDGKIIGYNISAGGGMGMTYGEPETYPNAARVIGFCRPEQVLEVVKAMVLIQRDFGDRANRKHARFKYTIDDRGTDWLLSELEKHLGYGIDEAREYHFDRSGDRIGWVKGTDGKWHLTVFIENGRIVDTTDSSLMTALREIAAAHDGEFRLTANQNLIISGIPPARKTSIQKILDRCRVPDGTGRSGLRRNAIACVALPTCGLAMAEAERYLPELIDRIEELLEKVGLRDDEIVIRMSGCPNGCSRPYLAEIAFTGKAPGRYNLYLGGGFAGTRLNRMYRENIGEEEILETLRPLFEHYARERTPGERFGDFVVRTGYVREVSSGLDFHADETHHATHPDA